MDHSIDSDRTLSAETQVDASVHSDITVFWWCAGIFAAGAIICGALLRPGPLTRSEELPAPEPSPHATTAQ